MIQLVLASILCLILIYALSQSKKSRVIASIISIFCLMGLVFVTFPGISTYIANLFGVGRGADLVIYLFVVIALFAIFNLHLRLRANVEQLTSLVRAIAIGGAAKGRKH